MSPSLNFFRASFFVAAIAFSLSWFTSICHAQEQHGKEARRPRPPRDTTQRVLTPQDSARLAASKIDTTKPVLGRLVSPVFDAGMITDEPSFSITDSEITWNDYTFSGEVLNKIPGTYLANMYGAGDPSQLYFDGMGSQYSRYLLDGVELNEPTTASMNLYHVPMEFVDNVEYLDALRAPIYQFNANGSLVNFQTQSYSEAKPYSKVRHLEAPYNYLITDGVFSQNIGFNSNIDAGFERQTTDGRFQNTVYDGVNIRVKYRYSIDSTHQLAATELYYRTKGGANGGSLPYSVDASIFDQNFNSVRSSTADLTYLQHHLQVAYSESDPKDSTQFYTLSAYYDYYNFEFGELANERIDSSFYLTNISRRAGANLRGSRSFLGGHFNFGLEAVREENPYNSRASIPSANRVSAYGDEEIYLFDFVKVGVFGRGDIVVDKFYPDFGASFGLGNDIFNIEAGGNVSDHVPSMSDKYFVTRYFVGNSDLNAETDKTFQLKAGVKLGESFDLAVKPYMKLIDDPIYFQTKYVGQSEYPQISVLNLNNRKIYGLDASVKVGLWKFTADGMLNYVDEKINSNEVYILPKIFASGELYFHDVFFTGHLDLKVGVRGQFETTFNGEEFYPEAMIFYPGTLNSFGPSGSSDFFVQGRVRDAVIYFTIFNITGQLYVLAPVYAALNTSFALGVNWEFLN
ncbi:MAG TPA: putative porin [Candidatus Acidoferrales bacterium]|nr:putative porin [Candidatus Acidoferrales bacterium]